MTAIVACLAVLGWLVCGVLCVALWCAHYDLAGLAREVGREWTAFKSRDASMGFLRASVVAFALAVLTLVLALWAAS